jgi:cytochrome c
MIATRLRAAAVLITPLVSLLLVTHTWAVERGTPTEARAMLQKAIAHYKAVGRKQALADFSAGKDPFRDRDLYVVCIAPDRVISANGAFPQYVGTNVDTILKDAGGKPLGESILGSVSSKETGSVSYMMINPLSGQLEPKTIFTVRLSSDVCGVGVYGRV